VVPVAFVLLGGYLSETLQQEDVARLHRLCIATAALANSGGDFSTHAVMEAASTQPGGEGFSWDAAGRKEDFAFFADLLGDEEDDAFAFDLDQYLNLTEANQARFDAVRHDYAGPHSEFLAQLLREQHASGGRQVT
jgi:hypothetical protein